MMKGTAERRDALRIELNAIKRDMKGINPKLSHYKVLEKRRTEIVKELEANGGTYIKA